MIPTARSHWMACEGFEFKTGPTKKLYHEIMVVAGTDFYFSNPFFGCIEQINKTNRGEISPDELKERQVSALCLSFAYTFFHVFCETRF